MITINKFESKFKPFAEFTGADITKLFESVRLEEHCCNSPDELSRELTLSITGFFNGKSLYVKPVQQLNDLLTSCNIYGEPLYKDVYLKIETFQGVHCLVMQYQQIIGSYRLFDITSEQRDQLIKLFEA